jgi:2-(1,2-epoxy-1,2-dihydrophenyl)acetyl-CoA isomerase
LTRDLRDGASSTFSLGPVSGVEVDVGSGIGFSYRSYRSDSSKTSLRGILCGLFVGGFVGQPLHDSCRLLAYECIEHEDFDPIVLLGLQRSGPVATLVLNRPERHNSLVPELLSELLAGFDEVGTDPGVRAVVLAAEGRSFSTGGDVRGFFSAGDDLERYAEETVGLLNQAMLAMLRLPQPIVVAVHGMVTGGSLGLVLGGDIVLAAPEVTITPWYGAVGFSPDGGWTALLPDVIGAKRAARVLYTNESIGSEEALEWGLATEIVPGDEIEERAVTVALEIAAMKPGSIAGIKRLLHRDLDDIAARLEAERAAFVRQILTPEAHKGMAAFLGRAR